MERRRLAAILAGDAVGYSRMMAEDEDGAYASLRAALDEVVTPAVDGRGGRVFKTTGDGFLAIFPSVNDALAAALAIQDGLASVALRFRLGLNLGDVIEEVGDVFGDGVNVAARIESLAEPGTVYVSAAVVRSAGRNVPVRFDRVGLRRAKNLPEPIELFVARRRSAARPRVIVWRAAAATAAVIAILGSGGALLWQGSLNGAIDRLLGKEAAALAPTDGRPSVAVLPFDNLSGDPTQDYFSDGLTEDIITDLARDGELMVIARNSTFAFKGQPTDIREVGAELGARYVVEGSARRADDQLRVVAQLIDAQTGSHLWSRSYDRRIEDVFAVQTDLTNHIVASLVSYVRQSEFDTAAERPTDNLRAYDLVLRGRERLDRGKTEPRALLEARDQFARAVELDPDYAVPRAYLALTHIIDFVNNVTGQRSDADLEAGLAEARVAIRLDPDIALGYQVLSYALASSGDYAGGMNAAEQAVQLNPSDPDSLMALAKAQVRFGVYDDAVRHAERARRLHPMAPPYYPYVHGQALYAADRIPEARDVLAECLLREPGERNCLRLQVATLVRSGAIDEARATLRRLIELDPSFSLAQERETKRFGDSPLMERLIGDLAAAGAPEAAGQAGGPARARVG